MIAWEAGAQQDGCKAQGFHHIHTPLVALNRLDFRRLAGEKMGFAGVRVPGGRRQLVGGLEGLEGIDMVDGGRRLAG